MSEQRQHSGQVEASRQQVEALQKRIERLDGRVTRLAELRDARRDLPFTVTVMRQRGADRDSGASR